MLTPDIEQRAYLSADEAIRGLRREGWFESGLHVLVHRICREEPRGEVKE